MGCAASTDATQAYLAHRRKTAVGDCGRNLKPVLSGSCGAGRLRCPVGHCRRRAAEPSVEKRYDGQTGR